MTLYLTREDVLAIGAQQLTDEYDDGTPPTFNVPLNLSRVSGIIVATNIQEAAADDTATAALQFRGNSVNGRPTISVMAGGMGNVNTGIGGPQSHPAFKLDVDIPLKTGLSLQLWGLLAGETGTIGYMSATAVLE